MRTITCSFSEIINVNEDFDLIMLSVFTAREDWYALAKLTHSEQKLFVIKVMFSLLKEINTLLYMKVFSKDQPYIEKINEFENYLEIEKLKTQYDLCANEFHKILDNYRNNTFHYSNIVNKMKSYFGSSEFKDFETVLHLGNTEGEITYEFPLQVSYDYLLHNFQNNNPTSDIATVLKNTTEFGVLTVRLLDALIAGFLYKKLAK